MTEAPYVWGQGLLGPCFPTFPIYAQQVITRHLIMNKFHINIEKYGLREYKWPHQQVKHMLSRH